LLFWLWGCTTRKNYEAAFTGVAPTIDGAADPVWKTARAETMGNVVYKDELRQDAKDLSARYRALWDSSALYVLVEVFDNVKFAAAVPAEEADRRMWVSHDYDGVDIILRRSSTQRSSYRWNYQSDSLLSSPGAGQADFKYRDTPQGYVLEAKLPLGALGGPSPGPMGFEILVADNDLPPQPDLYGGRESTLAWAGRHPILPESPVTSPADPAHASGRLVLATPGGR
jgi:hypothetical protein